MYVYTYVSKDSFFYVNIFGYMYVYVHVSTYIYIKNVYLDIYV